MYSPIILISQLALTLGYRPRVWARPKGNSKDFAGIAVALESCEGPQLADEINKLGVKHVLLRIPVWHIEQLDKYVDFIDRIPNCEVVICIMQTRRDVVDHDHWRQNLCTILSACWPRVKSYQIGQGVNRSKWGFFSTGEFLAFASVAEELRHAFKGIQFVGPGILDFETIPLLRGIAHGYPINWDVVGCALYVDRRGSPRNRQMLIFNLKQKIFHFAATIRFANKAKRRFWITEVNWPLKGHGAYAPTDGDACVDEESAGKYLTEYYEDAWATNVVERVYWWQLVAKGFGLMEMQKDGSLRARPAYHAFKKILDHGLPDSENATAAFDPNAPTNSDTEKSSTKSA